MNKLHSKNLNRKQIQKKNKIAVYCPQIYPLFNPDSETPFGGIEVQLYLISNQLTTYEDLEIFLITGDINLNKKRVENYNKIRIYVTLPIKPPHKLKPFDIIRRPINTFISLLKIRPNKTIIRGAGLPLDFSKIIAGIFCNFLRIDYIFSVAHEREVNGEIGKGLMGRLYTLFLDHTKTIILQSKEQLDMLKRWRKKSFKNLKVIKSGYNIIEQDIRNKSYILWVGRAVSWKQPEIFINLAKKFKNEKFLMICNEEYDSIYWRYIKLKAEQHENIKFLKFVPFNQIDEIFKNSKIFINTSKYEGFPNTFIQAMKNKTPILSLNVNPDGLLENYEVGLLSNGNILKLEEDCRELLSNFEIYKKYSNNGYLYVKEKHNINLTIKEWYSSLV